MTYYKFQEYAETHTQPLSYYTQCFIAALYLDKTKGITDEFYKNELLN